MDNLLVFLQTYIDAIAVGLLALMNISAVWFYERRIKNIKSEGQRMTGSIRTAHVRTILCDAISDTLDKLLEEDKITIDERMYWCQKFAALGLADLRHKPKPAQLKEQLKAKRIEEGKPLTTQPEVISMVEQLKKRLAS